MNFETHNTRNSITLDGGSLVDCITVSYSDLVKAFGKPKKNNDHKIDAEWDILFEDGVKASIYNYKDGKSYKGKNGLPIEEITYWHIGGFDQRAVENVVEILFEITDVKVGH